MQERYIEEADIPPCPHEDGNLLAIGGGQTEVFYCFLESEVIVSVLSFFGGGCLSKFWNFAEFPASQSGGSDG